MASLRPSSNAASPGHEPLAPGRPAYRCRHGYSSAARPDPTRAKNAYVREDQIVPHLAALAILLAQGHVNQVTDPAQAAELIDHLHSSGRTLTYDPQHRTRGMISAAAPPRAPMSAPMFITFAATRSTISSRSVRRL